jgi:hypothetical protein
MNTAEHIVESYIRLCRKCFTVADFKVPQGNNRQLDILAYYVKEQLQYHIEVGVTHQQNWCPTIEELAPQFDKKFFGASPERIGKSGGTTDFEKGKSYFAQIEGAYTTIGFSPLNVKRVWVCWIVKANESEDIFVSGKPYFYKFYSKHLEHFYEIEILSLRDYILPELTNTIGTANYDDEILRTLGFSKQRELQTPKR